MPLAASEPIATYVTHRRVEFGDTDMAGIAHFARFFHYMEAAETDFLISRGLNVHWRDQPTRRGFPRVSAACDYRRPAHFGDTLEITVILEKIGSKSLSYRHEFRVGGDLIAEGRITSVYVEGEGHGIRSAELPDEVRGKLLGGA